MGKPPPLFSVVTPVYNPPIDTLTTTIESVLSQTFEDWELILVDDCSPDAEVRRTLQRFASRDRRITVIERETNGHIVAASNDGIAAAHGTFIALLDHDDLLVAQALARNAAVVGAFDDVDYIYSDEDHIDRNGKHFAPFRKPDWSPERLRSQNYCCHLSVLRTALVRELGGFREGFDGSQDHDLILRVTERARRILHIPEILYHWRSVPGSTSGDGEAKPYAFDAGRRAIQEHLERQSVPGTVAFEGPGIYRISRPLPPERRVSIVIPTIGSKGMVWGRERVLVLDAVRSALAKTSHQNIEVVIVADEPTPRAVLTELSAIVGDRLRLVMFRERFNYSRKINFGVLASTGDRIVTLNDDTEAISDGWLENLLAPLEEADVGMTGAKLSFSSGTLQHAGIAFSEGFYLHPYQYAPADELGPMGLIDISREVSGVTGGCLGIRRETFLDVGGLNERLPEAFNDVDFSYKVAGAGYRILYVPTAHLFHFETMSRASTKVQDWEYATIRRRWGRSTRDPYVPVYPELPSWSTRP